MIFAKKFLRCFHGIIPSWVGGFFSLDNYSVQERRMGDNHPPAAGIGMYTVYTQSLCMCTCRRPVPQCRASSSSLWIVTLQQGRASVLFKRTQRSCILYKRMEHFLRSFVFFIKERNVICILSVLYKRKECFCILFRSL